MKLTPSNLKIILDELAPKYQQFIRDQICERVGFSRMTLYRRLKTEFKPIEFTVVKEIVEDVIGDQQNPSIAA